MEIPVWQFVRIMVACEKRPNSRLLAANQDSWTELDEALSGLAQSDFDAYSHLMMHTNVHLSAPNKKNPFTDHPGVFELVATQGGIADEWHSDITFEDQPSICSVLHMVKCPEVGGDTMWASLERAYDELSTPMRDLCESLTALHDALPHNRPDKMAIHPVVRVHPETGKKSLFVNEHFTRRIVEMNWGESRALLNYLTEWVKNARFTVRYRWTQGTIAIWDNRCTQHRALWDYFPETRHGYRVAVCGDKPF